MMTLKWEQVGTEAVGQNPPMPIFQCEIGRDKNGDMWLCEVRYREQERKFMILFDKNVYDDNGSPFLRHDVVNADSYWSAMRNYHMMTLCDYKDIQNVVREVIENNGLV